MDRLEELYNKMKRGEITKLKYYLAEKKITTEELRKGTAVPKRTLDDYVSGRRPISGISFISGINIADRLGVDPHDLI